VVGGIGSGRIRRAAKQRRSRRVRSRVVDGGGGSEKKGDVAVVIAADGRRRHAAPNGCAMGEVARTCSAAARWVLQGGSGAGGG
jgi:hypothetical protein